MSFERAVWAAFAQLFVTFDEAVAAIEAYRMTPNDQAKRAPPAQGEQ